MALSTSQVVALAVIFKAFLVCLVGFATPVWEYESIETIKTEPEDEIYIGLFYGCAKLYFPDLYDVCKVIPWDLDDGDAGEDAYFKAVRVLAGASIFFLIISNLGGFALICQRRTASSIAWPGALSALGGAFGVAGTVTFILYSDQNFNPFGKDMPKVLHMSPGWSFYLSALGSGVVLIVALMSVCLAPRQGRYVYLHPTTSDNYQYGSVMTNPVNQVYYSQGSVKTNI